MNIKLSILIFIHRAKLSKLIENDAPYSKILKQSQILDKYITQKMINMYKHREVR